MRWLAAALVLVSININAQLVLFDRTLSQPVYLYDASPSGISTLVDNLKSKGYSTGLSELNPDYYGLFDRDDFSHFSLVVTTPIYRSFPKATPESFKNYLEKGGHLILVAEHDNYYFNADNLNKICEPYGIKINNNAIKKCSGSDFECAWPKGKSTKYKLNNLRFYLPASLQCKAGVDIIATVDTAIVCASVNVGKGRLTVLGDYEMLWNMTPGHGINYGDNLQFLSDLIQPVIKGQKDTLVSFESFEMFQYEFPEYGGRFVNSATVDPNKIKPNDIVIFMRPVKELNWPDSIFNKIKKAIIVGDENSNYFKMLNDEGGINVLNALGYKHAELPINSIAKHFGIQFSESIVCTGYINDVDIETNPTNVNSKLGTIETYKHSAASAITTTNKKYTVFYKAEKGSKELPYHGVLGFDSTLPSDTLLLFPNAKAADGAIIGYYDKRVWAVSKFELWGRAAYEDTMYNYDYHKLLDWLKME
jgi:hypothetical protein